MSRHACPVDKTAAKIAGEEGEVKTWAHTETTESNME